MVNEIDRNNNNMYVIKMANHINQNGQLSQPSIQVKNIREPPHLPNFNDQCAQPEQVNRIETYSYD